MGLICFLLGYFAAVLQFLWNVPGFCFYLSSNEWDSQLQIRFNSSSAHGISSKKRLLLHFTSALGKLVCLLINLLDVFAVQMKS